MLSGVGPGIAPSIGIIGGGISGLACALRLERLGFHSCTVYDTGKRGVGGRASSRYWPEAGDTVDHAAQFFLAEDPVFVEQVRFLSFFLLRIPPTCVSKFPLSEEDSGVGVSRSRSGPAWGQPSRGTRQESSAASRPLPSPETTMGPRPRKVPP